MKKCLLLIFLIGCGVAHAMVPDALRTPLGGMQLEHRLNLLASSWRHMSRSKVPELALACVGGGLCTLGGLVIVGGANNAIKAYQNASDDIMQKVIFEDIITILVGLGPGTIGAWMLSSRSTRKNRREKLDTEFFTVAQKLVNGSLQSLDETQLTDDARSLVECMRKIQLCKPSVNDGQKT